MFETNLDVGRKEVSRRCRRREIGYLAEKTVGEGAVETKRVTVLKKLRDTRDSHEADSFEDQSSALKIDERGRERSEIGLLQVLI